MQLLSRSLQFEYAHPELIVFTTDPTTCGSNYFFRPSSIAQEDVDDIGVKLRFYDGGRGFTHN